jgi:hypothetical protein
MHIILPEKRNKNEAHEPLIVAKKTAGRNSMPVF